VAGRVASRTLPVFETWVEKRFRSEVAYRFLYRSIDGAKTSGEQADGMARGYGLPESRIWHVTQAVDLDLYGSATQINPSDVAEFRRAHGLHGCTFIYVGRLWKGKGVNFLVDAFRELTARGVDCSLVILGDGEDEAAIRSQVGDLKHVCFGGFVQPRALPIWYAAADVFVFPTLGDPNGLVVEEALAAGLPVISTENAGDIRSRVLDGETGFVVPAFDAHALSTKMKILASDERLRSRMSARAIDSAQRFSVQNYATDFADFIEGVLRQPPRSNPWAVSARMTGRAILSAARPAGAFAL
jgi:glycosyltransferase involved in cell wall biosynthesis